MSVHTAPPVVAPPPGNPRFPLMDSLRAVAALAVLFGHVGSLSGNTREQAYGAWIGNLSVGVTLFFLLSGFLLYRPFFNAQLHGRPAPRLRDYGRRRVLRIIPAYWLALTALAIYPGLVGLWGPDWWSYYALLQIYDPIHTLNGIPVAWTLCIEASFYVVLPFFAIATAYATRGRDAAVRVRVQLVVLALIALASVALRAVNDDTVLGNSLATHLYWFALGMALAVLSVAWQDRADTPRLAQLVTDRPGTCWALALVAYLALGAVLNGAPNHTLYSHEQQLAQHVLRGIVALFLILPAVFGDSAGGWPRRVLGLRWLAWLGLISYGIYLWHYEIIWVLAPKLDNAWVPLLVCALVVTTLCAAGSYYVVERPILRFKDFRGGRRAQDKAEGPARVAGFDGHPP